MFCHHSFPPIAQSAAQVAECRLALSVFRPELYHLSQAHFKPRYFFPNKFDAYLSNPNREFQRPRR